MYVHIRASSEIQRRIRNYAPVRTSFQGLVVSAIVVALILIILENMVLQVNAGGIFYNLLRLERVSLLRSYSRPFHFLDDEKVRSDNLLRYVK